MTHQTPAEPPQIPLRRSPGQRFVAVRETVVIGHATVARACSKTMAKRIANALNAHTPTREGV